MTTLRESSFTTPAGSAAPVRRAAVRRRLGLTAALVAVVAGSATAQPIIEQQANGMPDAAPIATFVGAAGEALGQSLASTGDVAGNSLSVVMAGNPTASGLQESFTAFDPGGVPANDEAFAFPTKSICFGKSLDGGVDLDLDGFAERLVGAPCGVPGESAPLASSRGVVFVFDGATGALLPGLTRTGAEGQRLGHHVAFLDDVAGPGGTAPDGTPEYAAGATHSTGGFEHPLPMDSFPGPEGEPTAIPDAVLDGATAESAGGPSVGTTEPVGLILESEGEVYVFDGASGTSLFESSPGAGDTLLRGEERGDRFGIGFTSIGDVDGDGVSDLVVGAPGSWAGGRWAGAAYVFSGADGTLIRKDVGATDFASVGLAVARVGNVDGDTFDTSADYVTTWRVGDTVARVVSGDDGSALTDIVLPAAFAGGPFAPAMSMAPIADLDGNGYDEVVIRNFGDVGSHVQIADSKTGETLYVIEDPLDTTGCFPGLVANVGDLNGMGFPEIAVTDPCAGSGGAVYVFSVDGFGSFPSKSPWFNELHYDDAGADTGELVEVAGPAGTDLTGWSVVAYDGSSGSPYAALPLAGLVPDLGSGFGVVAVAAPGLLDTLGGLALVDALGATVELISYEGSFVATSGPAAGMTSVDIGVSEASTTPSGMTLQKTGSGNEGADFTWSGPGRGSPGAPNAGQVFVP